MVAAAQAFWSGSLGWWVGDRVENCSIISTWQCWWRKGNKSEKRKIPEESYEAETETRESSIAQYR